MTRIEEYRHFGNGVSAPVGNLGNPLLALITGVVGGGLQAQQGAGQNVLNQQLLLAQEEQAKTRARAQAVVLVIGLVLALAVAVFALRKKG